MAGDMLVFAARSRGGGPRVFGRRGSTIAVELPCRITPPNGLARLRAPAAGVPQLWLAYRAGAASARFSEVAERSMSPPPETTAPRPGPDFSRGTDGLLPVIAQDARTGRVLMLAYMNEEAFRETLSTGQAVYYSRSRRRLWRKGEQSGHVQHVRQIRIDCDADTILLEVEQVGGAACHEGYESCFFRRVSAEGVEIVDRRVVDPATLYANPTEEHRESP